MASAAAEDTLDDLARLSDPDLVAGLRQLLASERHATARVVAYLAELDRRRLYLALGFTSLFKFCTDALHLSEDATFNRIEVARAARRHPVLLTHLASGDLSLTAIRLLAPHLTFTRRAHDKLRQAQALLRHQLPAGDPAAVLERGLDALLADLLKK